MTGGDGKPPDVAPDPTPDPDLPSVRSSRAIYRRDGGIDHFPSLDDYVAHHVEQGNVSDLDDLVRHKSHLIGELYLDWIKRGQVACLFARILARNPRQVRWLPVVQLRALDKGNDLGAFLSAELDAAAGHHEAAVLIFPDIAQDDEIVALVDSLCADPSGRWYRTERAPCCGNPAIRLLELRWILPSGATVNYVLGFADTEAMPATRRAPFPALFLRLKDKPCQNETRKLEDGRLVVHLADLDSTLGPDQELHQRVTMKTKERSELYVSEDLSSAARASITFSVSADAAKSLVGAREVKVERRSLDEVNKER